VIGSITHTADYCAAAVASRAFVTSIGIDVEKLNHDCAWPIDLICTQSERAQLEKEDANDRVPLIARLFSAKEAFYKCQYPVTREFLDFQDVSITFAGDCFSVSAPARIESQLDKGWLENGRFSQVGNQVMTTFVFPGG
jgi:4'-phosphopantetheinyl transferase EntD